MWFRNLVSSFILRLRNILGATAVFIHTEIRQEWSVGLWFITKNRASLPSGQARKCLVSAAEVDGCGCCSVGEGRNTCIGILVCSGSPLQNFSLNELISGSWTLGQWRAERWGADGAAASSICMGDWHAIKTLVLKDSYGFIPIKELAPIITKPPHTTAWKDI